MTRKATSVAPRPIFENHCFTMVKPMFSSLGALRKATFSHPKRALEKGGRKSCFLSDLDLDFDHQNGSKSDGKAPPFFDAMQTARNSSEVTGRHPFGTTYVAIHMIRSTICIYVYMYMCIYVYTYIFIYVYMYICIYVYMYICIYVLCICI